MAASLGHRKHLGTQESELEKLITDALSPRLSMSARAPATKQSSRGLRFLAVCRRRRRILEQRSRMRARLQRLKRLPALTWEQFMRKPALDPKRGGEAMFKKLFRMSREQFKHVQSLLEGEKEKDARRKRANGKRMGTPEKCEPPIALAMTLRFLAGGAVADIMLVY